MSRIQGEELRAEVRKVYNHKLADVLAALSDRADKEAIQEAFMEVAIERAKEQRERAPRG